jgi:thioredoxin
MSDPVPVPAVTLPAVTDATFAAEVEAREGLTVVDFWAPWCGPCRMLTPVLERLATRHAERLRVVKLDTDENPRTMVRFGVRGIPTLLVFRDGQLVDRVVGAAPYATVEARVLQHAAS